jgi:hypothetical protein
MLTANLKMILLIMVAVFAIMGASLVGQLYFLGVQVELLKVKVAGIERAIEQRK